MQLSEWIAGPLISTMGLIWNSGVTPIIAYFSDIEATLSGSSGRSGVFRFRPEEAEKEFAGQGIETIRFDSPDANEMADFSERHQEIELSGLIEVYVTTSDVFGVTTENSMTITGRVTRDINSDNKDIKTQIRGVRVEKIDRKLRENS